jgi:hypothetical protein
VGWQQPASTRPSAWLIYDCRYGPRNPLPGRHARTPAGRARAVWAVDRAKRSLGVGLSPLPAGRQGRRSRRWGLAHRAAQRVHTPHAQKQVTDRGMGTRGGAVYRINGLRPPDSAFFILPSAFPLGGASGFVPRGVKASGGLVSIVRTSARLKSPPRHRGEEHLGPEYDILTNPFRPLTIRRYTPCRLLRRLQCW